MSYKKPPTPRKQPKQSRSQVLVGSICDACAQIMQEEGPERLTTQRIADTAGINIASFYQYFPNKEAVLASVYERTLETLAAGARAQLEELQALSRVSLEETLARIIDLEVDQTLYLHQLHPDFYREYQHSLDPHRRVNEMTQALNNPSWESWSVAFLEQHREKLRSGDLSLTAFILRHALQGAIQGGMMESPGTVAKESFKRELLRLLLGYLLK